MYAGDPDAALTWSSAGRVKALAHRRAVVTGDAKLIKHLAWPTSTALHYAIEKSGKRKGTSRG